MVERIPESVSPCLIDLSVINWMPPRNPNGDDDDEDEEDEDDDEAERDDDEPAVIREPDEWYGCLQRLAPGHVRQVHRLDAFARTRHGRARFSYPDQIAGPTSIVLRLSAMLNM